MTNIELMSLRRQILDWRDKWLMQIPKLLEKDLPELLALLNTRIDQLSFKDTVRTSEFAEDNLQPFYERWVQTKSRQIIELVEKDLKSINQSMLEYNAAIEGSIAADNSRKNMSELGLATGSTGAALLGIPAVASLSVSSAGWGLGLLGVTVISWPIALGGAAVLGTMAVFGGSKLARFKEKAIRELKASVDQSTRSVILSGSSTTPSVKETLQNHIRLSAKYYLAELNSV